MDTEEGPLWSKEGLRELEAEPGPLWGKEGQRDLGAEEEPLWGKKGQRVRKRDHCGIKRDRGT